jgi:hypothetical protein
MIVLFDDANRALLTTLLALDEVRTATWGHGPPTTAMLVSSISPKDRGDLSTCGCSMANSVGPFSGFAKTGTKCRSWAGAQQVECTNLLELLWLIFFGVSYRRSLFCWEFCDSLAFSVWRLH